MTLSRKTPLRAKVWGIPRKPPSPRAPRTRKPPRQPGPTLGTRVEVRSRDEDRCQRCGTYCGPGGELSSLHHRAARRMGGTRNPYINSPANLLLLCGTGTVGCHGWVESHRTLAYAQGFLCHKPSHAVTTIVQSYRGPVLYQLDGTVTRVDVPDHERPKL